MYKRFFKRIFDLIISIVGLVLLSPVFLIVTIALFIANKGEPFFIQQRPGKEERLFSIIKFKTMNNKVDTEGNLLPDSKRLTAVGKFVRKTSLDELPQFINVISGRMSLVGPRPLLPEYLPMYDELQKRRHEVRPGITGLAQVKGRNRMLFSERLKNDVYYVDHVSLLLDIKIILLTIRSVLFKSGNVINGQNVEAIDDIGLTRNLKSIQPGKN
jgi:lipopolysaccharide/colanic/teichoic acid biosynthesis glycosyltransferase